MAAGGHIPRAPFPPFAWDKTALEVAKLLPGPVDCPWRPPRSNRRLSWQNDSPCCAEFSARGAPPLPRAAVGLSRLFMQCLFYSAAHLGYNKRLSWTPEGSRGLIYAGHGRLPGGKLFGLEGFLRGAQWRTRVPRSGCHKGTASQRPFFAFRVVLLIVTVGRWAR